MSIYPPVRDEMIRLLTPLRLSTYTDQCAGDVKRALSLYQWNLEASASLFASIHYFEVALRNAMHAQLSKHLDDENGAWFDRDDLLNVGGRRQVRAAKRAIVAAGHDVTVGRVLAELSLGFWWSLLAEAYNRRLWAPALQHAFTNARRQILHDSIDEIRRLRNRIAHHESLIGHDLEAAYARLLDTSERITPHLAWWIDATSNLTAVLARRPEPQVPPI